MQGAGEGIERGGEERAEQEKGEGREKRSEERREGRGRDREEETEREKETVNKLTWELWFELRGMVALVDSG